MATSLTAAPFATSIVPLSLKAEDGYLTKPANRAHSTLENHLSNGLGG